MDIIVTAPVALRATAEAAKLHREELLKRYAPAYVQKAAEIERYAMGKPEIACSAKSGARIVSSEKEEAQTGGDVKRRPQSGYSAKDAAQIRQGAKGASEAILCREIAEGGIEAALWELAKEHNLGLRAELRDIPIRQETVEVFNTLDLDPYRLASYGSWLCFADNGAEVLSELRRQGYTEATVIGYTTKDNKRLLYYSGVERYILPPERYLDK